MATKRSAGEMQGDWFGFVLTVGTRTKLKELCKHQVQIQKHL